MTLTTEQRTALIVALENGSLRLPRDTTLGTDIPRRLQGLGFAEIDMVDTYLTPAGRIVAELCRENDKQTKLHHAYKNALSAEYADRIYQFHYWQSAFLQACEPEPAFMAMCHEEGSAGE